MPSYKEKFEKALDILSKKACVLNIITYSRKANELYTDRCNALRRDCKRCFELYIKEQIGEPTNETN